MKKALLAATSAAALTFAANGAHAQAIDYGQLEQLFGESVTTSATGSPQRVTEVPADMDIITADDIRRSGAVTIPDVLRNLAGMDVRNYSMSDQEVSVRGYAQPNTPRLLVLINGRQVYNDIYGFTTWATLPVQMSEIRQIEVVKGPNTALFGFNAVGGVINIITYDPLSDDANAASVTAGTQADLRASGVATFHDGSDFGLRLSGGTFRNNEFSSQNVSGFATAVGPDYGESLSADSRYQVSPTTLLTGEMTWSQVRELDLIATGAASDTTYKTYSFKVGAASDTPLGLLDVDAYRNQVAYTIDGTGLYIPLTNTIYVVQASDLIKIGTDNILRLGLEYRDNMASSQLIFNGGHAGEHIYAASGMWNWQIDPALSLTNALRVDELALYQNGPLVPDSPYTAAQYNSTTLTELSFNSGLVYKAGDDDTLRLLASRGIQAPSLVAFGGGLQDSAGPPPVYFYGNPDLRAAAVMNYEFDYDRKLEDISSVLRLAVYHQDTSDVFNAQFMQPFVFNPAVGVEAQSANIGSTHADGGEIEIKGSQGNFRWDASYSLIDITDNFDEVSPRSPTDFAHGTPSSIVIAGGGYSWDRFEFDTTARWQSNYTDITNVGPGLMSRNIASFITFNARLGYNLTDNLTLAVSASQLNAQSITQTALVPTERQFFVTASAHL